MGDQISSDGWDFVDFCIVDSPYAGCRFKQGRRQTSRRSKGVNDIDGAGLLPFLIPRIRVDMAAT